MRNRAVLAAPLLLATLTVPLAGQSSPAVDAGWARIASEWRGRLERSGVVGASLGLVEAGELARLEVFGMADLASRRAVDRETIYHWASITKTFTAIAILQLRDRGLLSLDDPVVRYVPELRDVHNPFGSMEGITLRHLLSHSAGFRSGTWPWTEGEDWEPYEPTEWSQLVAMMPYTRILFPPGSRFSYSNPGIIFLGRVIEKVSGTSSRRTWTRTCSGPWACGVPTSTRRPGTCFPTDPTTTSFATAPPGPVDSTSTRASRWPTAG
jgi:CubicO group peptidase (beta-lactamase class C family)